MDYIIGLLIILVSFLCGSIPSGYLIVKKNKGIDIRKFGSGNIGSTNVRRAAGTKISALTQSVDTLKGTIPLAISMIVLNKIKLSFDRNLILSISAIAAILGHNYTPFLGFKGGKGVNTTIGVFAVLATVPTICGVIIYFILKLFTNIVSIRSMALGLIIPIVCYIMKFPNPIVIAAVIAEILIIIRHKENIGRLIRREEK